MSSRRALRRAGRVSPRAGSRRGRRALVLAAAGGPAPEPEHIFDTLGATWWIDAAEETTGGATSACQWALNRGSTSVPHARLGSTGRAELRGSYGLVLPGVSGNYASAPDSAALSITGDLDICADVTLVDWTPSANNVIACKGDASTQDSYYLRVNTSGSLELAVINAAGSYITGVSSVAPTVTDGAPLWVRGTVDIDNGANSVFKFYTSSDGSSWTQLGTTQTSTRITTSVRNGTSTLNVGCYASGVQHLTGAIRRVIIKNGYDGAGSTVFDADFTAATAFATSFTESSSNAATVTINATSGADTNDPLLLTHTGTNYLYLPGLTSNMAYAPAVALTNATVAIQFKQPLSTTLTGIGASTVAGRGTISGGAFSDWGVVLGGSVLGGNSWMMSGLGASGWSGSAIPLAIRDAADVWYRWSRDDATGNVTCHYSTDGTNWTAAGSLTSAAGALASANGYFLVGGSVYNSMTTPMTVRRMVITSSGTTVFDADFTANTNQSSFTESSSNAATVTINRASTGRKSVMVTRPVWLFGADDYMEVADNDLLDFAAADSFTTLLVMRQHATPAGWGVVLSKRPASTGYLMQNNNTAQGMSTTFGDGTFAPGAVSGNPSASSLKLMSMVRDVNADTLTAWNGTIAGAFSTDTTTGTLANAGALQIGRLNGGTNYTDMELVAVAVFRSKLTTDDLADVATYFGV